MRCSYDSHALPHSNSCRRRNRRRAFDGRAIDQFPNLCQSPPHPRHRCLFPSIIMDYPREGLVSVRVVSCRAIWIVARNGGERKGMMERKKKISEKRGSERKKSEISLRKVFSHAYELDVKSNRRAATFTLESIQAIFAMLVTRRARSSCSLPCY